MTPRLLLEAGTESEFLEAADWYAARSPALGEAFQASVGATLATIEEAPQRFPLAFRDGRKALMPNKSLKL